MKSIKEKPVIFLNSSGKKLWGVLSTPLYKRKVPTVLIAHGFNGTKSKRRFVELSRKFAENGIAVFRFDFTGCGDSEGEFQRLTILQQEKDLQAAIQFLLKQQQVNRKRIGILGHSLGALITCLFQVKTRTAKALVLTAPAINQESLIKDWYTPAELRKWEKQGFIDKSDFRVGVQYLREAKDYTDLVSKIEIPTLIIQGKKDDIVLSRYSRALLRKLSGKKDLILIKETGHDFQEYQVRKKFIAFSLGWFKKYL